MNIGTAANIILLVLLIGWLGYRQTTWRPVIQGRMWQTPVILGAVGLFLLVQGGATLNAIDIAVLVIELVISLAVGAVMGAIAHFRYAAKPIESRKGTATIESRTGWWGMALWLIVIAARVGIGFVAAAMGGTLGVSTATILLLTILLLLAVNRLARVVVIEQRVRGWIASPAVTVAS